MAVPIDNIITKTSVNSTRTSEVNPVIIRYIHPPHNDHTKGTIMVNFQNSKLKVEIKAESQLAREEESHPIVVRFMTRTDRYSIIANWKTQERR